MKLYKTLEDKLKKEPNYIVDNGELKKWVIISKMFKSEIVIVVSDAFCLFLFLAR